MERMDFAQLAFPVVGNMCAIVFSCKLQKLFSNSKKDVIFA